MGEAKPCAWARWAFKNHCLEPPALTSAGLAQRTEGCCSSVFLLSSLPETKFQSASADKSTSFSPPTAPVLLSLSSYYYSPKSSKGQELRADNLICYMLGSALMSIPLSRVPGHIFMPFLCANSLDYPPCLACLNSPSSFKARIKVLFPRKVHPHAYNPRNPCTCLH